MDIELTKYVEKEEFEKMYKDSSTRAELTAMLHRYVER